MLKKIAAATDLVVSVERAKARLFIETDEFDEDLASLSAAAEAALETQANIILATSSWEYRADYWAQFWPDHSRWTLERGFSPGGSALKIPAGPIRDVTGIIYLDESNQEQTISDDFWTWQKTPEGADVLFNADYSLPVISSRPQAVRVQFDAGYNAVPAQDGDDPDLVLPPQAEVAILFLVGHWHANREPVNIGNLTTSLPFTFEMLSQQLRVYR